jgi:hypothetical protein
MLVVDLLFATSSFACVITLMPSTNTPSVQLVLMTFTQAAISNSKNYSETLKYKCIDTFFLTISSTGA